AVCRAARYPVPGTGRGVERGQHGVLRIPDLVFLDREAPFRQGLLEAKCAAFRGSDKKPACLRVEIEASGTIAGFSESDDRATVACDFKCMLSGSPAARLWVGCGPHACSGSVLGSAERGSKRRSCSGEFGGSV